jgi:hypothetical protein
MAPPQLQLLHVALCCVDDALTGESIWNRDNADCVAVEQEESSAAPVKLPVCMVSSCVGSLVPPCAFVHRQIDSRDL